MKTSFTLLSGISEVASEISARLFAALLPIKWNIYCYLLRKLIFLQTAAHFFKNKITYLCNMSKGRLTSFNSTCARVELCAKAEAYAKLCETSMMEAFWVKSWRLKDSGHLFWRINKKCHNCLKKYIFIFLFNIFKNIILNPM